MNVSSVAHTSGVWATEETFISNTISIAKLDSVDPRCKYHRRVNVGLNKCMFNNSLLNNLHGDLSTVLFVENIQT
jgi:hypothetical protein